MKPIRISRRRQATTLTELLVALVVVAILSSLALSALRTARQTALSSECAVNLKTIGTAIQLYATENNNLLPAARYWQRAEEIGLANPSGTHWQVEISPYLGNEIKSVWTFTGYANGQRTEEDYRCAGCPAFLNEIDSDPNFWKQRPTAGHGMNSLLRAGTNYSLNVRINQLQLTDPASTVLLGDSDDYYINITKEMTPNSNGIYISGALRGDPVRHGNKANYLFLDNHVESLDQEEAAKYFEPK